MEVNIYTYIYKEKRREREIYALKCRLRLTQDRMRLGSAKFLKKLAAKGKEIPHVPAFALSPLYARCRPRSLYVGNEVGVISGAKSANRMIIGIFENLWEKFN